MKPTVDNIAAELIQNQTFIDDSLHLAINDCILKISSNSSKLIERLRNYFAHIVTDKRDSQIDIIAIQSANLNLPYEFIDVKREASKSGRKDACFELENGRLVKKVRTGMTFLQSVPYKIAAGDCLTNDNQVINFINSQYMTWLQHREWVICHAAGVSVNGQALAMAGFSGGGKSTLMLHLLNHPEFDYLTNDRLFIHREQQLVKACGIPKLPRINPGTLINNAKLKPIISPEKAETYAAIPQQELWDLEEKYDVDVANIYGKQPVMDALPLAGFLVLNWQRDCGEALKVEPIDLTQRMDLLAAVMKSAGPFYQNTDESFLAPNTTLDESTYLRILANVPIYEVSGTVDFSALVSYCRNTWSGL